MARELMKCGCVADGVRTFAEGVRIEPPIPVCSLHGCTDIVEKPSLEGRMAVCSYGGNPVKSSYGLAFFKLRLGKATDEYYCGCRGFE